MGTWLSESWNLAATVGVLGLTVMNWPFGLLMVLPASWKLRRSKNILLISLSLK
jgi:hypothetical protein